MESSSEIVMTSIGFCGGGEGWMSGIVITSIGCTCRWVFVFSSSVIWESHGIGWDCSVGWIGRTDAVGFDVLGVVRQIGAFSMVSSSSTPRYPTEISSGIVLLIIWCMILWNIFLHEQYYIQILHII